MFARSPALVLLFRATVLTYTFKGHSFRADRNDMGKHPSKKALLHEISENCLSKMI